MANFRITYDIITPESAENGDVEDRGYLAPGGMHVDVSTPEDEDAASFTLREALRYLGSLEDCGRWFAEVDPERYYRNGSEEYRSLHPPRNITPASYGRLRRLLAKGH
jgi:hypothetical protein